MRKAPCQEMYVLQSHQSWDAGLFQEKERDVFIWIISTRKVPYFRFKDGPFLDVMKNSEKLSLTDVLFS